MAIPSSRTGRAGGAGRRCDSTSPDRAAPASRAANWRRAVRRRSVEPPTRRGHGIGHHPGEVGGRLVDAQSPDALPAERRCDERQHDQGEVSVWMDASSYPADEDSQEDGEFADQQRKCHPAAAQQPGPDGRPHDEPADRCGRRLSKRAVVSSQAVAENDHVPGHDARKGLPQPAERENVGRAGRPGPLQAGGPGRCRPAWRKGLAAQASGFCQADRLPSAAAAGTFAGCGGQNLGCHNRRA
jgi:hypothetical protein